jgi:phosphoribosylglycinamide formyltransferase-1
MKLGVLASGEGTNLQALIDELHVPGDAEIALVAGDQPGARALARAREASIPTAVFARADYADRVTRDAALADALEAAGCAVVVLAGYMALLDASFTDRFAGRLVNVHPSLLPAFPGLRAIEQAVEHGVEVFGVTVHLVDAGVDTGPILHQDSVRLPGTPPTADVREALRPIEHRLLVGTVRELLAAQAAS